MGLAWPGLALGEAKGKSSVTVQPDQGGPKQVEIIRRISKERVEFRSPGLSAVPVGGIRTAQATGKPRSGPATVRR